MADLAGDDLVDRNARADVGGALLEPHAGEKRAVAARMIAGAVGPALGRLVVQAAQHLDQVPARLEAAASVRLSANSEPSSWATRPRGSPRWGRR